MRRKLECVELNLGIEDIKVLSYLAIKAQNLFIDIDKKPFIKKYHLITAEVPIKIRKVIQEFKRGNYDCLLISGLSIDEERLQPTPTHWSIQKDTYTKYLQFIHLILTANLGYAYSWQTQQNGQLASDILPIKGFEEYQQGFGSMLELNFHTEDPFHPAKADFISLMCMRNKQEVATTLFPVDFSKLPEKIKEELFKKQFPILPDESHTKLSYSTATTGLEKIFAEFNKERKISILYGSMQKPFIRIDPEIMPTDGLTDAALYALSHLNEVIRSARQCITLRQGEILVINNHNLPHGRGNFIPNYDGKDRWLERILFLEDIRKTINYRLASDSHIIVR